MRNQNSMMRSWTGLPMARPETITAAMLFVGLAAQALAAGPLTCTTAGPVAPFIRSESPAELVSDIVISCTGGISTTPGAPVPQINLRVRLNVNITSKSFGTLGTFSEALLIVDEPNSGRYAPNAMLPGQTGERPLLACGAPGAPDTSPSGPNVCNIIAPNHPSRTYDGLPYGWTGVDLSGVSSTCDGISGRPVAGTYGCGRPNAFQGRLVPGQPNLVEFIGVPFDPPGEAMFNSALPPFASAPWVRTFRIVNLRADAPSWSPNFFIQILADVVISGNTSAEINNSSQIVVANVTPGLRPAEPDDTGILCRSTELPTLEGINLHARSLTPDLVVYTRFRENFSYAWKTKGWEQMQANSVVVGFGPDRRYTGSPGSGVSSTFASPSVTVRQNVPGAFYLTESGFGAPPPPAVDPTGQNPPFGVGIFPSSIFTNQFIDNGPDTGIAEAGVAIQGTRLRVTLPNLPANVVAYTPEVVYLTRRGTNVVMGVAIRNTNADASAGPFTPPATPLPTEWLALPGNTAVYEIMYAAPNAEEDLTVPISLIASGAVPPVLTSALGFTMLNPPNHNLVNVGLTVTDTSPRVCGSPSPIQVQVFSDEDDETPVGNEINSPDARDIAPETLRLRAERLDDGDGRVYLVVIRATDSDGGSAFDARTVVVSKGNSSAAIGNVEAQAAAAVAYANANNGAPPPGYFVIGDGPVIGPKQ